MQHPTSRDLLRQVGLTEAIEEFAAPLLQNGFFVILIVPTRQIGIIQ